MLSSQIIGELIRACRKKRGLTQKELCERCDIKQSYLSQVETGDRNITFDTAGKIFNALNFSLDFGVTDLLNDT